MKRVNPPVGLCLENLEKQILMDKEKGKSIAGKLGRNYYSQKTKNEAIKILHSGDYSASQLSKILGVPSCTLYRWKSDQPIRSPKFRELNVINDRGKCITNNAYSDTKLSPVSPEITQNQFPELAFQNHKTEIALKFGIKIGVEFIGKNRFKFTYLKLGNS